MRDREDRSPPESPLARFVGPWSDEDTRCVQRAIEACEAESRDAGLRTSYPQTPWHCIRLQVEAEFFYMASRLGRLPVSVGSSAGTLARAIEESHSEAKAHQDRHRDVRRERPPSQEQSSPKEQVVEDEEIAAQRER